jgi:hypothetical protein
MRAYDQNVKASPTKLADESVSLTGSGQKLKYRNMRNYSQIDIGGEIKNLQ